MNGYKISSTFSHPSDWNNLIDSRNTMNAVATQPIVLVGWGGTLRPLGRPPVSGKKRAVSTATVVVVAGLVKRKDIQ